MQPWDILLLTLAVAISILIYLYIKDLRSRTMKLEEIKTRDKNHTIGGAMTIGDREVQEDCYYFSEVLLGNNKTVNFLALADGMGESYGGRIASRTAIRVCEDIFRTFNIIDNPKYFFRKTFNSANKEILKELDNGGKGSASLATALIYDDKLYYSVVGNVRVYVYRNNDLVEVSTGHTLSSISQNKFVTGKITRLEALSLLNNQRLYNYLGQDGFEDLEIFDEPISLKPNDSVILMSDGVYEILNHDIAEKVLDKQISSQAKAYEIIEMINKSKEENKDNASIIIWQS